MVRAGWIVAIITVPVVLAFAFLTFSESKKTSQTIALKTDSGFVVIAPFLPGGIAKVEQACRPPPVKKGGIIPVLEGEGVILVDEQGGQLLSEKGFMTLSDLDRKNPEHPFDAILTTEIISTKPDGSSQVVFAGPVPTPEGKPQEYAKRTFNIHPDGGAELVSSQPTTYEEILNDIAAQQQQDVQVVQDLATGIFYAYDSEQDAIGRLDPKTGEAQAIPVDSLPSVLGQDPYEFQQAIDQPLNVQNGVQYSATRIEDSANVYLVGIVPDRTDVTFSFYNVPDPVSDPSTLTNPVETITIPNPSLAQYAFSITISNVAPGDLYTYVKPELNPAQLTSVAWQQFTNLDLARVQQDPWTELTTYLRDVNLARPAPRTLLDELTRQPNQMTSVVQPTRTATTDASVFTISQAAR